MDDFNNFFDDQRNPQPEHTPVYHTPSPKNNNKLGPVGILCVVLAVVMCVVVLVNVIVLASLKQTIAEEYAASISADMREQYREAIDEALSGTNVVDDVTKAATEKALEALKTIEILNENHVNLYFANYGIETLLPDGSVNPIARLILTICLEISAYERNLIRYRMKAGYEDYLKRRKSNPELRLGRQGYKKDEQSYRQDYAQELSLLRKGISMRNVQKLTGTSLGTLQKIKQYL